MKTQHSLCTYIKICTGTSSDRHWFFPKQKHFYVCLKKVKFFFLFLLYILCVPFCTFHKLSYKCRGVSHSAHCVKAVLHGSRAAAALCVVLEKKASHIKNEKAAAAAKTRLSLYKEQSLTQLHKRREVWWQFVSTEQLLPFG